MVASLSNMNLHGANKQSNMRRASAEKYTTNTNPVTSLTSAAASGRPEQPRLSSSRFSTFTTFERNERKGARKGGKGRREGGGEINNQ